MYVVGVNLKLTQQYGAIKLRYAAMLNFFNFLTVASRKKLLETRRNYYTHEGKKISRSPGLSRKDDLGGSGPI